MMPMLPYCPMKRIVPICIGVVLLLGACTRLPVANEKPTNEIPAEDPKEGSTQASPPSSPLTGTGALPERLLPTGILEVGQERAPLTLLIFTNHSCRYCLEFEEEYVPRLVEDFVKPGKLRLQISILKLQKYPESVLFLSALVCAAEQGKGFPMHTKLFDLPPDRRTVLDAAESLTMDTERF